MGWIGVVLALTLPWLAASLWLRRLWPQPLPGLWPLVLGYGYLFGLLGVALILALQGSLGWPVGAGLPLGVAAVLAGLALWRPRPGDARRGDSTGAAAPLGADFSVFEFFDGAFPNGFRYVKRFFRRKPSFLSCVPPPLWYSAPRVRFGVPLPISPI